MNILKKLLKIIILILPLAIIFLLYKYGNDLIKHFRMNTYNVVKDFVIPSLSILVTGILSYFLYCLEKNKNKSEKIISVTSIYFSLISGFEYIFYRSTDKESTRALYIEPNWLEKLSVLNLYIKSSKSKEIFEFLKNVNIVASLSDNKDEDSVKTIMTYDEALDKLRKSVFDENLFYYKMYGDIQISIYSCLKDNWVEIIKDIEKILKKNKEEIFEKNKYKSFLNKIVISKNKKVVKDIKDNIVYIRYKKDSKYNLEIKTSNGEDLLKGTFDAQRNFNGYKIVFNTYGEIKEQGEYKNNKLYNGEIYNKIKSSVQAEYQRELEEYEQEYENEKFYSNIFGYDEFYKLTKVVDGKEIIDDSIANIEYVEVSM